MAIKALVLGCDWCEQETRDYEDEMEAAEHGWWLCYGPAPVGDTAEGDIIKELAFCKSACRDSYFDYYNE